MLGISLITLSTEENGDIQAIQNVFLSANEEQPPPDMEPVSSPRKLVTLKKADSVHSIERSKKSMASFNDFILSPQFNNPSHPFFLFLRFHYSVFPPIRLFKTLFQLERTDWILPVRNQLVEKVYQMRSKFQINSRDLDALLEQIRHHSQNSAELRNQISETQRHIKQLVERNYNTWKTFISLTDEILLRPNESKEHVTLSQLAGSNLLLIVNVGNFLSIHSQRLARVIQSYLPQFLTQGIKVVAVGIGPAQLISVWKHQIRWKSPIFTYRTPEEIGAKLSPNLFLPKDFSSYFDRQRVDGTRS